MKKKYELNEMQIDRIIEMAWEDRTPFDAILVQFGLKEQQVITLMRREMKKVAFGCGVHEYKGERQNTVSNVAKTSIDSNAVGNGTSAITRFPKEDNFIF